MSAHGQELRPEDSAAYREAVADLRWLAANEALAGVAEIVRERRRQVEVLGYGAEHDDSHDRGELVMAADSTLHASFADVAGGVAGYPECEESYRQAGALLAAEMDRLLRMLTPGAGS